MDSNEKYELLLTQLRAKEGFICDMDGVIYHGNNLLPGVREFVNWLYEEKKSFLFLTNASERSFYVWDWRLTKVISIPVLSPLPNLSIRRPLAAVPTLSAAPVLSMRFMMPASQ